MTFLLLLNPCEFLIGYVPVLMSTRFYSVGSAPESVARTVCTISWDALLLELATFEWDFMDGFRDFWVTSIKLFVYCLKILLRSLLPF
jgi:hypothetical protein